MAEAGHNNPPLELSNDELQFLSEVLLRDLEQGLAILVLVQKGDISVEQGRKTAAYMEQARPVLDKMQEIIRANLGIG